MTRVPSLAEQRLRVIRAAKALASAHLAPEHKRRYTLRTGTLYHLKRTVNEANYLVKLEKYKRREINAGKKAAKTRRRNEAQWKQQQRRR